MRFLIFHRIFVMKNSSMTKLFVFYDKNIPIILEMKYHSNNIFRAATWLYHVGKRARV